MAYERRDIRGAAAETTLNGDITNASTTIILEDATGWPTGSAGNFLIVIDRDPDGPSSSEEKILCSSRTTTSLTVVPSTGRGYDGTSAVAHTSGAKVEHCLGAVDMDEANYAVSQTVGKATTIGDTLYASAANTFSRLAKGTSGQFYKQGGSAPAWATIVSTDLSNFTEAVQDVVGAYTTAGTNITVTYDDAGNTLTIAQTNATSTGITDFTEAVQDVIGALGLGGSGLTFTYTDGSNTAVIDVNVDGSTLEVNADSLRVKDGGITQAKVASGFTMTKSAAGAPSGTTERTWFDTTNNLLYLRNSSDDWVCITPKTSATATLSTRSNTAYGDLADGALPTLSMVTSTKALVSINANMSNATAGSGICVGFAVSGASTVAATDVSCINSSGETGTESHSFGATYLVSGLTAGTNTFTMKYRSVTSGTISVADRSITVVGIP